MQGKGRGLVVPGCLSVTVSCGWCRSVKADPVPACPTAPQYMPTIWGLLFSRLQSSRTAKFTR